MGVFHFFYAEQMAPNGTKRMKCIFQKRNQKRNRPLHFQHDVSFNNAQYFCSVEDVMS